MNRCPPLLACTIALLVGCSQVSKKPTVVTWKSKISDQQLKDLAKEHLSPFFFELRVKDDNTFVLNATGPKNSKSSGRLVEHPTEVELQVGEINGLAPSSEKQKRIVLTYSADKKSLKDGQGNTLYRQ